MPATSGEAIIHFNAVRMRVKGVGYLRMKLTSLDTIYTNTLTPLLMATATNVEPTQLANISQQRSRLEIRTTDFGDYFDINRIIIYAKPLFASFPQ